LVGADRSPAVELTRERRVAALLVRRFALRPPVDVFALAQRFARVEADAIPGSCDGLVLGLHGAPERPTILLRAGQHEVRHRFTIAHELGHILLPWHLGDGFLCLTEQSSSSVGADYAWQAEQEANRFASELLVPTAWLLEQRDTLGTGQVGRLLEALLDAQVSTQVACLRLLDVLPAGHLFAIVEGQDVVLLAGQTQGTRLEPPPQGERLRRERIDPLATRTEVVERGSRRVIWWTFREDAPSDVMDVDDDRTASDVLSVLLNRHAADVAHGQAIRRSLAGILGVAFDDAQREGLTSSGQLYAVFRGRFARPRRLPDSMLADPAFDLWLRKRAAELSVRL